MAHCRTPQSVRSNGAPVNHKPSITGGNWASLAIADSGACARVHGINLEKMFILHSSPDPGDTGFGSNAGAEVQPEWLPVERRGGGREG